MGSQLAAIPRTLAVESSSASGSIALLDGAGLVVESMLPSRPRIAQTLIPEMARLLRTVGWEVRDLELIAVVRGPGSFTGLRVGITAAKTLAYATGTAVIGVDTLEVLAFQAYCGLPQASQSNPGPVPVAERLGAITPQATAADEPINKPWPNNKWGAPSSASNLHAVLDAQRGELFQATFRGDNSGGFQRLSDTHICDPFVWAAGLDRNDYVTGTGLKRLTAEVPAEVSIVGQELWVPRAAAVGLIAQRCHAKGRRDDLWKLAPDYIRKSAAEEKAERDDSSSNHPGQDPN